MATFGGLLILCFLSSAFAALLKDKPSSKLLSRILNKRSHAAREHYQWHVFISSVNCSGVFVHGRWILTSAFCVQALKTHLSSAGLYPVEGPLESDRTPLFIRVGNHKIDFETPGVDSVPVLETFVYPKYNANTSIGNFGLLYLARDVLLPNDQRVSRIELPGAEFVNSIRRAANRSAKVTGWGHVRSSARPPFRTLHEDDVWLARVCLQNVHEGGNHHDLLDRSWCVESGTHGMCSIDQGSPLVIQRNRSWLVLGVYARGETCISGKHAALFSSIDSKALEWMQKLFTVGDKPQCRPSGYQVLVTPARGLSNKVKLASPLCDNNLKEAWYKLEINGSSAEIPTSCPEIGSCGTHGQIWIPPEGHPGFGEERNGSACVAWKRLARNCCMWQLPVQVTHCGDFVVYRLKRTQKCSIAYCAREARRIPCGPGKIGYVPRCKVRGPYPTLAGPPQITPVVPPDNILASSSVHLLCTYDIKDPRPFQVVYKVTWYKIMRFLGGKPGKLVLRTNTTEETAVMINFESAEFHLGDTIACEVTTFYSESPDVQSPGFPSRDFYVGVKVRFPEKAEVEPSSLVISEDHKMKEITISLTVPLVCPTDHPNCTIQIPMHLVPAVVESPRMLSTPDLAFSTCEVTLKPHSCSRRDCGLKVVRLVAVSDFINDGDRRRRIITEPARSQSPLWNSYDPPDAFVLSKDIPTPRCYLFTESYIRTLSGRYYRIPSGVTTFVSFKSTMRPFEVHTRFWTCSKSVNPSFCVCGVAARDGDDVIVIDMCGGRFMETSVQISVRSGLPLTKRIRITEATSGKRYTVYFPSGVYIRTDVFEWGLNVQIQSSGRDFKHVTGLCGVGGVSGSGASEGLPDEMNGTRARKWRLLDSESLFRYKPLTERRHQTEKFFCLCSLKDNIEKRKKCKNCESKCRRRQHIVWPAATHERDITRRVQTLQISREKEHRRNVSNEFYPFEENLSDLSDRSAGGDSSDSFLAVLAVNSYCKRLLTDSPVARTCTPIIGQQNVDQLLRICIRDMRYTGISSIAWGAAVMFQDLCEDLISKNASAWEVSSRTLIQRKSIVNIFCPRLCSDRGRCIEGICKCRRGYTSDDCSVDSRRPPKLIRVNNDGQCDITTFHCKQIRVVGEGFHNSRDLLCSVAKMKQTSVESQTFLSKATYESYRGVMCDMPISHDTDVAVSGYEVRVSNDGRLWSQPLPFIILDGHCLTCTARDVRCEIKNGTCRIDGRCRRQGESNFQDHCKWCSPRHSQQNWTDMACQSGSCTDSICVHGVCLDKTRGRYFCYCDEGFRGPRCDVPENWCSSNPCGRGTCIQQGSAFRCECPLGFTGRNCSEIINPCSSDPCNNGSCVTNGTHFRCFCEEGFTGQYCETKVQEVLCSQGQCISQPVNAVCTCPMGFTVKLSELCPSLLCGNESKLRDNDNARCVKHTRFNDNLSNSMTVPCRNSSCVNGSQCASSLSLNKTGFYGYYNFTCVCEFGFAGSTYVTTINATESLGTKETWNYITIYLYRKESYKYTCFYVNTSANDPEDTARGKREPGIDNKEMACLENNTISRQIDLCQVDNCSIEETTYLCMLDVVNRSCGCVDHDRLHCREVLSYGALNTCNHGNCSVLSDGFLGNCSNGQTCNETRDPCYSSPCLHGNCTSSEERIHCVCETGYKGNTCSETTKDFCEASPCIRGECKNTGNGFRCICPKGFSGTTCNQVKTPCRVNICKHGVCFIEPNGKLSCECFPGYQGTLCETPVDRCQVDICNNGWCVNKSKGFRCLCLGGFTGKRCHVRDPCTSKPCVNGHCTSKPDGYYCSCHRGYTGKTCNETIDLCQTNPCVRGQCLNTEDTYVCRCPEGSTGVTCTETINFCKSNPCVNGDCVDMKGSFKCECRDGFEGVLCDKRLFDDPCRGNPCGGGRCLNVQTAVRSAAKFHCLCNEGFTGKFCESKLDPCANNPCEHGLCVDPDSLFHCLCDKGYTGMFCESKIDPCSGNPCKHGLCEANDSNSFRCDCFKGFQGSTCDIEINHCISSPCKNGSCFPKNDSFECSCSPGYNGKFCELKINPCKQNPCKHGLCVAIDDSNFQCKCFKGFQGGTCETEINPCISSPCKNGSCIAKNYSFECLCNSGYNGSLCDQTVQDMCEPNPCKHGRCLYQGSTSIECACDAGYTGTFCETLIDSCRPNPCKHGVCVSRNNSFKCYCKRGYSGEFCHQEINPCKPNPCKHGSCLHWYTSWFTCRCELGYTGKLCNKEINMCQSHPCKYGKCIKLGMSFQCRCTPGFHGRLCDKTVSCQSRPCKRGICIPTAKSFTCRCPETYTGRYCENKIDPCHSSPCQNGTCAPMNYSFKCICEEGYTGRKCEIGINPCSSQPCKNGKCIVTPDSFSCRCPEFYSGRYCENKFDPCQSNPCQNGTCMAMNDSFKCICDKGYTGENCEVPINPCSSYSCKNGTCVAKGDQYSCRCYQGFSGKHCDADIDECLQSPCFDGVQCTNYLGGFTCGPCPDGFTGNGTNCREILTDHCENLNCFGGVPCVLNGDKYECGNCPSGFTGNGVQCTEMDVCSPNPCHPMVQCFTEKGSQLEFRCGPCPEGYTGNGIKCTSLCPLPCPYGMKCTGYQTCRCPEGFQGVGCKTPFCRAGCYNGGTCAAPNVCKCREGYDGPSCLSPVCQPPCRFDGKCIGPGKCRCPHGFLGSRCQERRCLVNCLNGGRCIGPYACRCLPGYSGQRCEIAPCSPRCQNGGLCVARNVCKCPPQYLGERCQFPLCRPPCINGGHCIRPNVCMCPIQWKGDHCQKPVCHLPCLNGGRCARPNQCTCLSGYGGIMCEKAICNQRCLNGGQCIRPGVCACAYGFTGRRCEERDPWTGRKKLEN